MIETKKKNLIVCGNCESHGQKSVLGEMGTSGEFIVQRFHQGETIIKAPILSIICGVCKNVAFYRNEGTVLNPGSRILWEQTSVSIRGTFA